MSATRRRNVWCVRTPARSAASSHGLDAPPGAPVDRLLQEWNEQELRAEYGKRDQRHPGLRVDHVARYAEQDAGVEQRLREAGADEAADRLDLRDDDRDLDAFGPRRGCVCRSGRSGRVHLNAQAPVRGFGHRPAIDVHHQLQRALHQDHGAVGEAQQPDEAELPPLHGTVDDAPLQLQGRQLDQEKRHCEQRQQHLVPRAYSPDVAVKILHHAGLERSALRGATPAISAPWTALVPAPRAAPGMSGSPFKGWPSGTGSPLSSMIVIAGSWWNPRPACPPVSALCRRRPSPRPSPGSCSRSIAP